MLKGLFAAGMVMATASLACSIFVGGPTYSNKPIPISTETAQSLKAEIQTALASTDQTGIVTFQFNESQLTTYLAQLLETQTDPFITDPQILLREGEMIIFGKAQSGIFMANISVSTQVCVDQNGEPKIIITQSEFGPLPAPSELNNVASALLGEVFTGSLEPATLGFRLQSISITKGMMIVTGRLN